jgi:hypothetical protein
MLRKIRKKSKLKSEKIWKIWRKSKLNSEKIWKIWKISVLIITTHKENSSFPSAAASAAAAAASVAAAASSVAASVAAAAALLRLIRLSRNGSNSVEIPPKTRYKQKQNETHENITH